MKWASPFCTSRTTKTKPWRSATESPSCTEDATRTSELPSGVYDEPATQFVAEFLGACNLLPVTSDHGQLRLPDGAVIGARPGSMVNSPELIAQVGVRPEKMLLQRDAGQSVTSTDGVNVVRATVTTTIYLGATSEYELTTPWGGHLHILAQNISDADRHNPGDQVVVTWEPDHGFALPAANSPRPVATTESEGTAQ